MSASKAAGPPALSTECTLALGISLTKVSENRLMRGRSLPRVWFTHEGRWSGK